MVAINYAFREISCKIVFYGPGLSGKTTNLQYVHQKVPGKTRGELISLATDADRTLYFDFLPINLGAIQGFSTKFQLYTVPGQVYYNATRKLVLRGVDGLVFVADSQRAKMDENVESLKNLYDNLEEYGYDPADLPMVIQYNKRDLPDVMSVAELQAALNPRGLPHFEAVAVDGAGVFDTLKCVIKMVLDKARKGTELGAAAGKSSTEQPAAAAAPTPQPAEAAPAPTPQSAQPAPPPDPAPVSVQAAPAPAPAPSPAPSQAHPVRPAPAPGPMQPEPVEPAPAVAAAPTPQPSTPAPAPQTQSTEPNADDEIRPVAAALVANDPGESASVLVRPRPAPHGAAEIGPTLREQKLAAASITTPRTQGPAEAPSEAARPQAATPAIPMGVIPPARSLKTGKQSGKSKGKAKPKQKKSFWKKLFNWI